MTPEEAAFVLEPIWLGFAAARWRLAEINDRMDPMESALAQARQVSDLQDASAYLATVLRNELPAYAIPLYARVVPSLEVTSTFKSLKGELRKQGFADTGADPLYVLVGGADGYVPAYDGYAADVAAAKVPDLRS